MNEKIYKCECGKEFTTANSFNGHKTTCKQHHLAVYGNLDKLNSRNNKLKNSSSNTKKLNKEKKIIEELLKWKAEQHRCEHCGTVMKEKYGTGKFCSRSCANSRNHSAVTKAKIGYGVKTSQSFIEFTESKINTYRSEYSKNPNTCTICGSILPYDKRHNKVCSSEECLHKQLSQSAKERVEEDCGNCTYGKRGFYKGIRCDSTYELVYVIYNFDHNIEFTRNTDFYWYVGTDGEEHKYFPDFKLADGTLVEIKGRMEDNVLLKIAAVDNVTIQLLQYDDLKYAFDYVKETYCYRKLEDLYDKQS